jgi:hypothetical protein
MRATDLTRAWREPTWHRVVRLHADSIGQVLGGGIAGILFAVLVWWGIA